MELLTEKPSALEEAQATNRGLIKLLSEQARTIGFTQFRLECAASTNQVAAMRGAADFLRAYFGPVDPEDQFGWSDQEARKAHDRLIVAMATPNRPEEIALAADVSAAIAQATGGEA